ncbi:hypothetical protein JVT61DRAFT_12858 [Boletus reticuloceps]|uniref:Uncharacterized protein n=1 Tax=Boletus reticuloceps TaxID=495285 RepID=A0A8I3ADM8_9AGAM|nr:hypothetical protein JVT61DRAFT_12858 [Boletus reticuloceps]
MQIRRSSASVGHTTSTHSSSRAHRSNDSHHGLGIGLTQPPSIAYSAPSATPQQKNVQALINRIKNKLPVNSGLALDVVEGDPATQGAVDALVELAYDSLDIIAWSLSELLERLAKQIDDAGAMTIEALQSQLFVLKILSVSMSSRWSSRQEDYPRSGSRASKPSSISGQSSANNITSVPSSGAWHSRNPREFSSSTPPLPWVEIDPLDDNCARYVLSVMVLYLRQTAAPESRLMSSSNLAPDASLHDFESVDIPTPTPDDHAYEGPPLPPLISQASKPLLRFKPSATSFQSSGSVSGQGQFNRTFHFERTHMALVKSTMALNILISKFAGRIVYFYLPQIGWWFSTASARKFTISPTQSRTTLTLSTYSS